MRPAIELSARVAGEQMSVVRAPRLEGRTWGETRTENRVKRSGLGDALEDGERIERPWSIDGELSLYVAGSAERG